MIVKLKPPEYMKIFLMTGYSISNIKDECFIV